MASLPSLRKRSANKPAVSIASSLLRSRIAIISFSIDELPSMLWGERLLDANRTIGQPNKITVIFGRKITQHYRGTLQTVLEDLNLPNPVIRSHYGHGFIKQYVRDDKNIRTIHATNNVNYEAVNKASD